MANVLDLLTSWRQTVKKNGSLSMLYVLYQFLIFVSSILGPATIILLIAGALQQVWSCKSNFIEWQTKEIIPLQQAENFN